MVLPIGFFAPLPLPMMIPFMGIQSAVMAEQFGTLFQYGKRRISAMSNEEFNKLTPQMLQDRMTKQIQHMIPEMEKQIQAMRPMTTIIIKEFLAYLTSAGEALNPFTQGGPFYTPPPEQGSKQQIQDETGIPTFLQAGAEEVGTLTTSTKETDLSNAKYNNYILSLQKLSKIELQAHGKVIWKKSGFTNIQRVRAGNIIATLILKAETKRPDITGKPNTRWRGTSSQSLHLERLRLIKEIRFEKATLINKQTPAPSGRVLASGNSIRKTKTKIKQMQQKLADLSLELSRRR